MIPKKLTIKGLYSYSEEATIDFEQLSQAHIFGIFGNVGSGKSAILEAMMLALYGEVPRLGHGRGDNRNFNIMNLKSNDLCIDFEFEAGGKKYKSIVEAKRNSKKFEEVSAPKPRRFEWDAAENRWQPNDFEPADVIGLKLEHFTKTIIVPQNQFQEFLQLKDTERSKMMSDLFNLERFDLAKKAVSLENKNKMKLSEVQIQLDQIGDVTKEQIKDIETEIIDLEKITNNDSIELKEKQQTEAEAQQLKKQFGSLEKLKIQLIDFENRTPQYNDLEKQLNDFEYCQLHFQNLIEQANSAAKSVAENAALLAQKRTAFSENEQVLNQSKAQQKTLHSAFDNRHNRLREAEELDHIWTIQKAEKTIAANSMRIEKGEEATTKKRLEIDALKQHRTKIETERAALKSPNVLELQSLKDWFSKYNGLKKDVDSYEIQIKSAIESLDTIEAHHKHLLTNSLPLVDEKYPLSIKLSETILAIKKGIQNRESAKLAANQKLQHELAILKIENLATTLAEGDPCPLCGSVHHPEVMNATDVNREVAAIEKEIGELNLTIKSLENMGNQVETHFINFRKIDQDRLLLVQQVAEKRSETEGHAATFHWSNFSKNDENAVNIAFTDADKTVKRIAELDENRQEITKKIEKETTELTKYEEAINRFRSEIAVENGQKQTLEKQLQTLKLTDYEGISEEAIFQKKQSIKEEVKALEIRFADIEKEVEKRAETDAILRGSISELERNQSAFDKQLQTIKTTLDSRLAASNFSNIESVKPILSLKWDVELERKQLNNFRADHKAALKLNDELRHELQTKNYNTENHQALLNDIQELGEKIESQNRYIGGLKGKVLDLKNQLNRRNQLEKERHGLELRAKNIGDLKRLFYASGFVSYVSTVFLKNLCETANHRFERLTNHRLRLEITADNTFLVRDLLNDGQTRHVKTLSGGQTFQAALSLALALADNIQTLTKSPQNFFFLDEGFGSLDKDSLQIVFDTLKSLRKENRIVGVISHVEEMQQEIERYVRVVLDEERGSQLSYY